MKIKACYSSLLEQINELSKTIVELNTTVNNLRKMCHNVNIVEEEGEPPNESTLKPQEKPNER